MTYDSQIKHNINHQENNIMKKILFLALFVLINIGTGYGQKKISVAVLEHDAAGVSLSESQIISDRLRTELFRTEKFIVLEREKMNDILTEQGFQQTGCTTDECALEIGRLINVQVMVVGKIGKIGNMYTISSRIIDVESGKILRIAVDDCKCPIEDVLTKSVSKIANILSGTTKREYDERQNQLKEQRMIEMKDDLKSPGLAATTGFLLPIAGHAYIGKTSNIIRGSIYTVAAATGIILGLSWGIDNDGALLFYAGIGVLVISGIDAGISASNYNDELLNEGFALSIDPNFNKKSLSLQLNYNF